MPSLPSIGGGGKKKLNIMDDEENDLPKLGGGGRPKLGK